MSVTDAFNDDQSWRAQFLTRVAHFMLYGIALFVCVRIPFYLGVEHDLLRLGELAAIALFVVGLYHDREARLCVRCMQEVPADATQQAERQRWALRLLHMTATPWGLLVTAVVVLGSPMVLPLIDAPPVAHLPGDLLYVLVIYAMWLHHRLRPWCPYCRDWGDEDAMAEPSPDPTAKATR